MAGPSLVRLALALVLMAALQVPCAVQAQTLETYRGRAPAVFIVAPGSKSPALAVQMKSLKDAVAGVLARDLVVIELDDLNPAQRQRFDVAPDAFQVILVGIDGKVIQRWDAPVAPATLFALIDAAGK
ncbi:MAG TPA: DUF4174 domain-containing protein [Xanthobacteraceae bacterium]|uniref:DUF4174 domain-containing protein n=1 Tax=Roseixanthobacter finlandensis TaxID=3119922 RepID=UPI0026A11E67|nr:DUF4174 domain-containing protein [Xanthobacteraceae bacterium]HQS45339.1 DUF4174 domain-containing protein [Xanthobacteraceae bacterium]